MRDPGTRSRANRRDRALTQYQARRARGNPEAPNIHLGFRVRSPVDPPADRSQVAAAPQVDACRRLPYKCDVSATRDVIVEFRDVGLHAPNGRPIVSGLTFDVRRGEVLVLLGRSGSGKTTTLKMINALLLPGAGEVRVEGTATTAWDRTRLRRRIGYVIQEIGLFPHLTVANNVAVVPTLEGWPDQRKRARVRELLQLVGLDPAVFADRYPSQLSGGQRQRVGVARALAADPPLLLLDEPFGAVDPLTRLELQRELKTLHARLGKTMVFVTHDVREGLYLASRVGLLCDGELAFIGPPAEFLRSSVPEAAAFVEALRETEVRAHADPGDVS